MLERDREKEWREREREAFGNELGNEMEIGMPIACRIGGVPHLPNGFAECATLGLIRLINSNNRFEG